MTILVIVASAFTFGALVAYLFARVYFDGRVEAIIRRAKEQATRETLKQSSATLKGQIGERFAPLLPGFGYEPADARFLGSPVDYVVFDGLADGEVKGIAFVEVKTGPAARLTPFQREVKAAIDGGHVVWRVVNIAD